MRSADGTAEVPVATYELLASTELLGSTAMQRMMAKFRQRYPAGWSLPWLDLVALMMNGV